VTSPECFAMEISTFGQVLEWVHDRLSQVETNMHTNPQSDPSEIGNVSSARTAIEALLSKEPHLEDEYIKAAETEYESLVALIQSRNIPITDELQEFANQLRMDQD